MPQQAESIAELPEALEGVVLALDGNEDGVGRGEAVDSKQAKRGWAVQQHIVEGVGHPVKRDLQSGLPGEHADQLHLCP